MEPVIVNPEVKNFLSEKNYARAKHLVQVVLPALGTLYFTLAQIWGLPAAEQIVGTIAAVALFLGLTLQISGMRHTEAMGGQVTRAPYVGDLVISSETSADGEETFRSHSLELNDDLPPDFYEKMHAVAFRIERH